MPPSQAERVLESCGGGGPVLVSTGLPPASAATEDGIGTTLELGDDSEGYSSCSSSPEPEKTYHTDHRLNTTSEAVAELTLEERFALSEFRSWVMKSPEFVNARTDDSFLVRFLRARNFHHAESRAMFRKYFKVRDRFPHAYRRLDVADGHILDLLSRGYMFPLRERDPSGRTIIFARSAMFGSCYGHRPTDLFRTIMLTFETLLDTDPESQRQGFVYVFDSEGVTLSEVAYVGIWEMQRLAQSGERSVPMKHKEIHWLHLPTFLMTCYHLVSSFISAKLRKRFRVHDNLESLYEALPREILPEEYGGQGGTIQELADEWISTLRHHRERNLDLDRMSYDSSLVGMDAAAAAAHLRDRSSANTPKKSAKKNCEKNQNSHIDYDSDEEEQENRADGRKTAPPPVQDHTGGGGNFLTRTWRRTLGKSFSLP